MRFLFLKKSLHYPRATGHDVHTFEMARALAALGHDIGFATVADLAPEAVAGLELALGVHSLATGEPPAVMPRVMPREVETRGLTASGSPNGRSPNSRSLLTYLQRRFLRYWGIDAAWLAATARLVQELEPDAVVAAGLEMLPCLAAVRGATRIWYAADEYARHHLTQVKLLQRRTWRHLADAAIAAAYERSYAHQYDRAWVVSSSEARAMKSIGGARHVDIVPNGVDAEHFHPGDEPTIPHSCAFWGRLDAGPNIAAASWFVRHVWPALRREFPDARFGLFGFAPVPAVLRLQGDGIAVTADAPDLRPLVRRHEVAVMPFVSGGGIKNKLLEAAAMAMPIVATPQGCVGLDARDGLPLVIARRPEDWVAAIARLWRNAIQRAELGAKARAWVGQRHTWEAAARCVSTRLRVRAPEVPA